MARGLLFGALAAALLLASAHARALKHQPPNTCQYLPNTYLTTGLYLNRYAGVSTADACCQLCQSEFGGCGLFTWCPADATEGCFTGGTGGFLETAGACTLYSTASGWTPTLNQQGPQTKWISGAPPNATLPDVPQAKPGVCAPHNNTMLAGTYIQGTTEPTVDACCDRCSNNPDCAAWSYCPAGPGLSCVILSGKQDGQTCNLYSLQPGQKADVVQQGPETTWISGYRDPEGQYPVPDVTATAPEGCNFVENTMLTSKEPWLGGWYNVADADTCCTLCRNTPTCGVWAYCPLLGGQPCVTSYGQESPASCLVYPAADPSSIYIDQRSNETTWISGLKYIKEYEIPA